MDNSGSQQLVLHKAPVMTVFLDGFEVLCVDVLVGIVEQGALQSLLCAPGLRPGLQVLLDGLGDAFVMRRHDLGSVPPVHLNHRRSRERSRNKDYCLPGRKI